MPVTRGLSQSGKFEVLQAARGIAAVAVVLCHLRWVLDPKSATAALFSHFYLGVDIFFIISGFVIASSTGDKEKCAPSDFLIRRLFRIVPLAWTVIFLIFLLSQRPDPGLVLRGLLFLPENPSHNVWPFVNPNWSLSYELCFYAMFGIAMAISHRFRCELCLVLILVLTAIDWLTPASDGAMRSFFDSDLFLEFGAGIVLARIVAAAPRPNLRVWVIAGAAAVIVVGLSLCVLRPLDRGFSNFGGGVMLVFAGLLLAEVYIPIRLPRGLSQLGELSYAIYISQVFAFHLIWPLMKFSWLARYTSETCRLILILLFTIAIAKILHHLVEKPGIKFGRRLVANLNVSVGVSLEFDRRSLV